MNEYSLAKVQLFLFSGAKVLLFFQQDRESLTLHPLYTLRYLHLLARL